MALQGSSANLQGGGGISLQGSTQQVQRPNPIAIQGGTGGNIQGTQPSYTAPNYAAPAIAQNNGWQSQISNLLAQLNSYQRASYAPALPTNFYSNAQTNAENAVNPYYTSKLNQFLQQQNADKVTHQQQAQTDIQNLQDQLANTLQANQVSQARTGQDVLQQEQQIGIKADQQQQDQGTQFDQARIAQAKQLAAQGLTTSGEGAQQVLQSQTDRNTQESRQAADTQQQVQAQELLKSRTFEDLARSGELATQSEAKGEKQTNFDLNNYISQQGRDLISQKDTLEQERQAKIAENAAAQRKIAFAQYLNSLTNPAQRTAAAQAYGGSI